MSLLAPKLLFVVISHWLVGFTLAVEIAELRNCSLEHHAEWFESEITKHDGKQYTEVGQIDHDPTSFT